MESAWRLSLNRSDLRIAIFFSDRVNVTPEDLRALAYALSRLAGTLDVIRLEPAPRAEEREEVAPR